LSFIIGFPSRLKTCEEQLDKKLNTQLSNLPRGECYRENRQKILDCAVWCANVNSHVLHDVPDHDTDERGLRSQLLSNVGYGFPNWLHRSFPDILSGNALRERGCGQAN